MQNEKSGLTDNAFSNHKIQTAGKTIVETDAVKAKEFMKEKK